MKILSKKKFELLKNKANGYDDIHKYLATTINIEPKYTEIKSGIGSVLYHYTNSITTNINVDINKLYELAGIHLPNGFKLKIPSREVNIHIDTENESEEVK